MAGICQDHGYRRIAMGFRSDQDFFIIKLKLLIFGWVMGIQHTEVVVKNKRTEK